VECVPFQLNKVADAVKSVEQVAAFLQEWKRHFTGDSFIFEYYGGGETMDLARVMWQDIRALRQFDVNGMISCQALRVFFPCGLGMVVMGRTLWNSRLDFDEIARDYFAAAYGPDGQACLEFIASTQAAGENIRRMLANGDEAVARAAHDLRETVRRFAPVIKRNQVATSGPCLALSWRMMVVYSEVLQEFLEYTEAKSHDERQAVELVRTVARQHLFAVEDELQPYLQPMHFLLKFIP